MNKVCCHDSAWEAEIGRSGVQGHPHLPSEFEASLDSMKRYQQQKKASRAAHAHKSSLRRLRLEDCHKLKAKLDCAETAGTHSGHKCTLYLVHSVQGHSPWEPLRS